jgi:hypothetical protein
MAPQKKKITVRTPAGVARFPHVHKPDNEGKFADGKFKATIVFDGDVDLDEVNNAALAAAKVFYPAVNPSKVNVLIKEGDDETKADGTPIPELQGKRVLTAKSKFSPQVVGPDRQPLPEGVEVRGGDLVRLLLEPVESPKPVKNSVSWRLLAVQLVKKREGGGHDYSSMFDEEGEGFAPPGGSGDDADTGNDGDDDLPF